MYQDRFFLTECTYVVNIRTESNAATQQDVSKRDCVEMKNAEKLVFRAKSTTDMRYAEASMPTHAKITDICME